MNRSTIEVLLDTRKGQQVRRCHTLRVNREQTNGEHSAGVAKLLILLYRHRDDGALPRPELLAAALFHDDSEGFTGDMPATTKWENPTLRQVLSIVSTKWEADRGLRYALTNEEQAELRWADMVEFALYAAEEVTSGNRHMLEPLQNASRVLAQPDRSIIPTDLAGAIYAHCFNTIVTQTFL